MARYIRALLANEPCNLELPRGRNVPSFQWSSSFVGKESESCEMIDLLPPNNIQNG
jgi:hypothetical protein